jgi:uncharacterized spore protein YtfJ
MADIQGPDIRPQALLMDRLAEKLGGSAKAATIYGAPVEHDGVTVIPVAKAMYGFGGGSGNRSGEEGSGGGGGVMIKPVGYIEMKQGSSRFYPIRDPLMMIPAIALGGILILASVKSVIKLFRAKAS